MFWIGEVDEEVAEEGDGIVTAVAAGAEVLAIGACCCCDGGGGGASPAAEGVGVCCCSMAGDVIEEGKLLGW